MTGTDDSHGDIAGTAYEKRPEFLIAMYDQLMSEINRHIIVVWQIVSVIAAAVAALVLAERNGVPVVYAMIVIIAICMWAQEHIYDSNYWYNRNLVMITNIERVFLSKNDLELIHPYFGKHRPNNSFLSHLDIQRRFSNYVVLGAILYFMIEYVIPTLNRNAMFDYSKFIPFIFAVIYFCRGSRLNGKYITKYKEFLAISPGIKIDHAIDYGTTHGKS